MNRRIAHAVSLSAIVAALVLVPVALAGKGGNGGGGSTGGSGSSLAVAMVSDANGNGSPNWGDTITFKVSTTATTQPEVRTVCFQNGAQAYFHEGGFYPGDPWAPGDQMYILKSYGWTAGSADCTATMFYMNRKNQEVDVTSMSFHVDA